MDKPTLTDSDRLAILEQRVEALEERALAFERLLARFEAKRDMVPDMVRDDMRELARAIGLVASRSRTILPERVRSLMG